MPSGTSKHNIDALLRASFASMLWPEAEVGTVYIIEQSANVQPSCEAIAILMVGQ